LEAVASFLMLASLDPTEPKKKKEEKTDNKTKNYQTKTRRVRSMLVAFKFEPGSRKTARPRDPHTQQRKHAWCTHAKKRGKSS
jgi:hypothetical protein